MQNSLISEIICDVPLIYYIRLYIWSVACLCLSFTEHQDLDEANYAFDHNVTTVSLQLWLHTLL